MKKVCLQCKKEFSVPKNREGTAKYCSRECHNKSLIGHIPWNKGKRGIMPIPWNKGEKVPQISGKNRPHYS